MAIYKCILESVQMKTEKKSHAMLTMTEKDSDKPVDNPYITHSEPCITHQNPYITHQNPYITHRALPQVFANKQVLTFFHV